MQLVVAATAAATAPARSSGAPTGEQLVDGLLALVVAASHAGAALAAHRVNLIDEDDAGGLGLGLQAIQMS
jgi:hypothetical protein